MKKQKNKEDFFKPLKNLGFKKVKTNDGLLMFELTPSKLNPSKK